MKEFCICEDSSIRENIPCPVHPPTIYGFYEEEYPSFSDKWESELQYPVDPDSLNYLVERLRAAEEALRLADIALYLAVGQIVRWKETTQVFECSDCLAVALHANSAHTEDCIMNDIYRGISAIIEALGARRFK